MTREQFKQRMQNLKSYRESNPGKGYWEWRNSLPDNLKYTDDNVYDMFAAYQAGAQPELNDPQRFEGGGEVQFPYPEVINGQRVNRWTGKPIATGQITPLFDLETAAGFTPIGDAMAVNDIYQAAKERDWTGLGLAALGFLPFVPSGLRNARKAANRMVPSYDTTVNKNLFGDQLERNIQNANRRSEYLSEVANEKNRIFEDINSIPYRHRSWLADKLYGTNYDETYDLIDQLYQNKFFSTPQVYHNDLPGDVKARLQAKSDKARDYFSGKTEAPGAEDFEFPVNGNNPMDAGELAQHELNHYTDFIISRNPNTTYNNAMLTQLENSLKSKSSSSSDYYRKGTEQKAYMNQLRRKMYKEKIISTIDEPVSEYKLKKYISKLPESNSIKKAFNEHKSLSAYTRWFNSIPLLGLSPLVISNMREEDK